MAVQSSAASRAANLACVLHLLRHHAELLDEVEGAFRVLRSALADRLRLQVAPDELRVDGTEVPLEIPGADTLRRLLLEHGIGELETPADEAVLLPLLRTLAVRPEFFRTLHDLTDHLDPETRAAVRLTPPARLAPAELQETVYADMMGILPVPEETAAAAPQVVATAARSAPVVEPEQLSLRDADRVLEALEADPPGADDSERLNDAVALADLASQLEDWDRVVTIAEALVRCEGRVEGELARRPYGIALRRIFPRSVLEPVARLVATGRQRDVVVQVLQRMGADATEVLLAHLIDADAMEERRNYYSVLRQITEGTALLINMLTHDVWYVVRNVADLCGDLKIEEAVPDLARRLEHEDERVRRSAAGALAKIGTPNTIEPLRTALRDESPVVRLQVLGLLGGRAHRGLAMTLAVRADEETHPDVLRETYLALGRIGTPEAVQALARAAEPGGKLFRRKGTAARLAAVEGLALVEGSAAAGVLRRLADDADREVRAAASRVLERAAG
jgi:HEAT repeat protein